MINWSVGVIGDNALRTMTKKHPARTLFRSGSTVHFIVATNFLVKTMDAAFSCQSCKRNFSSKRSLNIHLTSSDVCSLRFRGRPARHSSHATDNSGPFLLESFNPVTQSGRIIDEEVELDIQSVGGNIEEDAFISHFEYNVNLPENRVHSHRTSNEEETELVDQPLDSGVEFLAAVMSCNYGRGMSKQDLNRWLALLKNPHFKINDVPYCNAEEVFKAESKLREDVFGTEVTFVILHFCFKI